MSKLKQLANLGQSIWFDYIRRSFIANGDLQALIDDGVRGVTSNPTIFEKAIAGSADYDAVLRQSASPDQSTKDVYEKLIIEDIGQAADLFRPLYEASQGVDGHVSLEVSPTLADDTAGTIQEAIRLFATLRRPNIMIKVPATAAGISAIAELLSHGINVNATLIFNLNHYRRVAEAYLSGLERLLDHGGELARVASVASFFISRIDVAVDRELERVGNQALQGKIAIASARLVYAEFRKIFSGARWQRLADAGARVQRLLWASTGTRNPLYSDTLYVDSLIGSHTVNAVLPATLNAYQDHGTVAVTIDKEISQAQQQLSALAALGIDLSRVTEKLQQEGIAAFTASFEKLMSAIAAKQDKIIGGQRDFTWQLNGFQSAVDSARAKLKKERVIHRIWQHDYTVWKPNPAEISNRMGWLQSPDVMMDAVADIRAFVDDVRSRGFTHALLLGMGGSSLAPDVFRRIFAGTRGYLALEVLDSTAPEAVLAYARRLNPNKTLFIASTKSGGTVETLSFLKYFYNLASATLGKQEAGQHFVAITDPGSGLEKLARQLGFRKIFLNDPHIGGRYSALSYFGLVPAGLIGVDLPRLLDRAQTVVCNTEACNCPVQGDNTGAILGAILGELSQQGVDKVTFIASSKIEPFGYWIEQLIAESTGKQGTGIVPVVGESVLEPDSYARDRLFVYLKLGEDTTHDKPVKKLIASGFPLLQIHLHDEYDLGGEFFRWEMATAIAGYFLNINPFDQPDVEAAKVLARKMVAVYQEQGRLPESEPTFNSNGIAIFSDTRVASIDQAIRKFLASAIREEAEIRPRSYVAIQAFIQPSPEADRALQELRTRIQATYRIATTVGYGPRFLHSTGQLHKGDAGAGLFIQITEDHTEDIPIPDEAGAETSSITFGVLLQAQALGDRQALLDANRITFGVLLQAQALGDRQALLDANRRVIRFHFSRHTIGGIMKLAQALH